jgi:hypothetical protein
MARNLGNSFKKCFSYKPRFCRYTNIVSSLQMTAMQNPRRKDNLAHARRTCGAVETVQVCVMELSYRTASRHHERLIMGAPGPTALFAALVVNIRKVASMGVGVDTERSLQNKMLARKRQTREALYVHCRMVRVSLVSGQRCPKTFERH